MSRSASEALAHPLRAAFHLAHVGYAASSAATGRWRRRQLLTGIAVRAWWHRARVACQISPDVRLGRRLHVVVEPRSASTLAIAADCKIGDDVRIELRGGALSLGEGVDIRARCTIGASGAVDLVGHNVLQHVVTIHCDEAVVLGRWTSMGEYASVVDSSHTYDGTGEWVIANVRTAPVTIGENTWLGAKVTVARGVTIGDRAVIAANSVVVKDVPSEHFASGVPAQVLRRASTSSS